MTVQNSAQPALPTHEVRASRDELKSRIAEAAVTLFSRCEATREMDRHERMQSISECAHRLAGENEHLLRALFDRVGSRLCAEYCAEAPSIESEGSLRDFMETLARAFGFGVDAGRALGERIKARFAHIQRGEAAATYEDMAAQALALRLREREHALRQAPTVARETRELLNVENREAFESACQRFDRKWAQVQSALAEQGELQALYTFLDIPDSERLTSHFLRSQITAKITRAQKSALFDRLDTLEARRRRAEETAALMAQPLPNHHLRDKLRARFTHFSERGAIAIEGLCIDAIQRVEKTYNDALHASCSIESWKNYYAATFGAGRCITHLSFVLAALSSLISYATVGFYHAVRRFNSTDRAENELKERLNVLAQAAITQERAGGVLYDDAGSALERLPLDIEALSNWLVDISAGNGETIRNILAIVECTSEESGRRAHRDVSQFSTIEGAVSSLAANRLRKSLFEASYRGVMMRRFQASEPPSDEALENELIVYLRELDIPLHGETPSAYLQRRNCVAKARAALYSFERDVAQRLDRMLSDEELRIIRRELA